MTHPRKARFIFNAVAFALNFLVLPAAWSASGLVQDINYDASTSQLVINASSPVVATVNTLTVSGHRRAVIDLDNAEIGLSLARDQVLLEKISQRIPNLAQITVNQYGGNGRPIVRILLDFTGKMDTVRLVDSTDKKVSILLQENKVSSASLLPTSAVPKVSGASIAKTVPVREPAWVPPFMPSPAQPQNNQQADVFSNRELEQGLLKLNMRYQQLSEENQQLKNELAILQRKSSTAALPNNTNADTHNAALSDLKMKLANMATLQAELQKDYQAVKEENEWLKPAVNQTNTTLKMVQAENAALKTQLAQASKTLANQPRQQASVAPDKVLEAQILQLTSEKKTLQQTIAQLKQSNALLTQKQANQPVSTTASVSIPAEDMQNLKKQLELAKTTLSQSVQTINSQSKEIAYLQNQLTSVQSGLNFSAQEQLTRLEDEKHTLEKRLQEKETERLSTQNTAKQLALELKTLQEQMKLFKTAPASQTADVKAVQGALQQKNDELAALELQYRKAQTKADQAQAEIATLKQLVSQASSKTVSNPSQLNKTRSDETLLSQLAVLKKQQGEAQALADQLRTENKGLQQQLAESRNAAKNATATGTVGGNSMAAQDASRNFTSAEALLKNGDLEKALDDYKTAVLLNPDSIQYVVAYSNALTKGNQYAEATDTLKRYIKNHPDSREAYSQLAKVYLLDEQPEIATQYFSQALSSSVLNNYGTALKKLGKTADAEMVFNVAISLSPKDSELLFNLGNLYNAQNKLEKARNKYLEAIDLAPDFAEAHYNLGLIFSKMGDKPSAIKHLETFLQLSPNVKNASTIRSYIDKLRS